MYHPLFDTLAMAVPFHIAMVHKSGGLTDEWIEEARACGEVLARADELILYRGKTVKNGEVADAFNRLAKAIAILSFFPNGIVFGGTHYDATVPFPHVRPRPQTVAATGDRQTSEADELNKLVQAIKNAILKDVLAEADVSPTLHNECDRL